MVFLHLHPPKQNAPSQRQQSMPLTKQGWGCHNDNWLATTILSRISRDLWTTCTSAVDTEAVIATPSSENQLQLQWRAVRFSLYSIAPNASSSKSKLQVLRITRNNQQSGILLKSCDFVQPFRPKHGFPRSFIQETDPLGPQNFISFLLKAKYGVTAFLTSATQSNFAYTNTLQNLRISSVKLFVSIFLTSSWQKAIIVP